MRSIKDLLAHNNNFSSFPSDFFTGLTFLDTISIDHNPFAAWQIPDTLKDATALKEFSATETNITGRIPDIFNSSNFPGLNDLHLAFNCLEGELPASFFGFEYSVPLVEHDFSA
ncbi:receptor protein kinase TMK1 [Pyrus ussuriensis x Pyrus communis]|uniref:Receptor protein kinase TMK1 n=1 Tax=Pyrus ussuriensis x Pyrus communis TaxID=2448454 RepID=A0A5N5I8K9_9ROSA|nr:receptor protein kinase TMK1 [Pyrus ussuriensis x Pyrus communis]